MTNPRKVRWLIAHKPEELFIRTAEAFRDELNKRIPGQIDIEIVSVPTFIEEQKESLALGRIHSGDTQISAKEVIDALFAALHDDHIQLSQIETAITAQKHDQFKLLDLPFLFEDHDHVTRVMEGGLGAELCEDLSKVSDIKGLAFTYSGGYRIIGSNEKIDTLDELKGKTMLITHEGLRTDTFKAIGVKPVVFNPANWIDYDAKGIDSGIAETIETTYLRFNGKHILKTNHSMFMTTIVSTNKFWASLTPEQQTAFAEVAELVARIERDWAIGQAEQFEQNCVANGVEIVELSKNEQEEFEHKARYVYLTLGSEDRKLVAKIRNS
jgi:TRAP-type C4-dicarboxylate transport system substrate-binding protein